MNRPILKPKALRVGSTIGVFTPSSPAYKINEGLFENGLKTLHGLGFKTKLGHLTATRAAQGYRSGTPQERAREFMELIEDPEVDGLISTIGGMNSNSMIPFLDFEKIRESRKVICGFSDVTSLHLAILKYCGLRTIYGPSVMCWFGEWPSGLTESNQWFLDAVSNHSYGPRKIQTPARWSNHRRNWTNGDWQNIPRQWNENTGWKCLRPVFAEGEILALNLNTLLSAAGTPYWPDLSGKILLLEDMYAPQSRTERGLYQLKLMGVFEQIVGLIFGKPEEFDAEESTFTYDDLIMDAVGPVSYPVVSNFDCAHTVPMISIPQLSRIKLSASDEVEFEFLEGGVLAP